MQMIDKLSFFYTSNFSHIKDYYSSLEKDIISIGEFIGSDEHITKCIAKHIDYNTIIDISYLCSMKDKLQFIGENLIINLSFASSTCG